MHRREQRIAEARRQFCQLHHRLDESAGIGGEDETARHHAAGHRAQEQHEPGRKGGTSEGRLARHAQREVAFLAEQEGGGEKAEAEQSEGHHQGDDGERRTTLEHDQGCGNRSDRQQLKGRIEDQDRSREPETADDELRQRMKRAQHGAQHGPCSSQRRSAITAGCSRSPRASSA